jgi:hypothetical protein
MLFLSINVKYVFRRTSTLLALNLCSYYAHKASDFFVT